MPTAPLFYQPLVMARVQTTQVGKANVIDSFNQQQKLIGEAYQNPKFRPAIDGIVTGFTKLQEQLPNSRTLETPQFAFDDEGYVANRVMTTMRLHPNLFDTASPDQAAEIGAKLVEEAKKELGEDRIMRAAGDTLEFTPRATLMLKHAWEGNELDSDSVAELGINAARELQRSVTPLEPDATHPTLQWIEDATANALGMWDGVAAETASALGLKADPAKVAKSVEAYRSWFATKNPQAASHISSLGALLGSAGISGSDDKAAAAAFQVLQGGPLDGVPASIAQGIVGNNTLPPDAKDYIAGRIVETTGSSGNVKGLLAEIELMKRPVPVDPPGGGTPPPDGGTPPPGGGEPVPPPGGETPPPVDPPKDGDTPKPDPDTGDGGDTARPDPAKPDPAQGDGGDTAKPDPATGDGGDTAKPDPAKGDGGDTAKPDPAKGDGATAGDQAGTTAGEPVDPPATDGGGDTVSATAAGTDQVDVTSEQVLTAAAQAAQASDGMSEEEFKRLQAQVRDELGPHPADAVPDDVPPSQAAERASAQAHAH